MGQVIVGKWPGSVLPATKLYIILSGRTGKMVGRPYKFKHHAAKRMLAMGGVAGSYYVACIAALPEIVYSRNTDGTLKSEGTT